MALRVCLGCGCRFAVGLGACPQCWSEENEEADVAKITTGGGASLHTDGGGEPGEPVSEPETAVPVPVAAQLAAGVAPAATVTIAEQKAGTSPPAPPAVTP
jgi:hypothetical protein